MLLKTLQILDCKVLCGLKWSFYTYTISFQRVLKELITRIRSNLNNNKMTMTYLKIAIFLAIYGLGMYLTWRLVCTALQKLYYYEAMRKFQVFWRLSLTICIYMAMAILTELPKFAQSIVDTIFLTCVILGCACARMKPHKYTSR